MEEIIKVFGINGKLLVIQAVNFGILLSVLWYFLYRPVVKMISDRRAKIADGVRDAEEAAEARKNIEAEKEEIIALATKEGNALVEEARAAAREKEADLVKDAHAKSEAVLREAAEKAEELKRRATEESKTEIARMAILAAERVLRKES